MDLAVDLESHLDSEGFRMLAISGEHAYWEDTGGKHTHRDARGIGRYVLRPGGYGKPEGLPKLIYSLL